MKTVAFDYTVENPDNPFATGQDTGGPDPYRPLFLWSYDGDYTSM